MERFELCVVYRLSDILNYLAIDRTNWGCINLFVVSVIWNQRSFPIYFELLSKLGSSNLDEQKTILSEVLPLVNNYDVCVFRFRTT